MVLYNDGYKYVMRKKTERKSLCFFWEREKERKRKEEREEASKYTACDSVFLPAVKSNWTTTAPMEAGVLSKGNIQYMQNGYYGMNPLLLPADQKYRAFRRISSNLYFQ